MVVRTSLTFCTLVALSSAGCARREGSPPGDGVVSAAPSTTVVAPRPQSSPAAQQLDPTSPSEGVSLTSLLAGVAVPPDPLADDGEVLGLTMKVEVRPRFASSPPFALGAVPSAFVAAARGDIVTLDVALVAGRARLRFGANAPLDEGSELRAARGWAGCLHVTPGAPRYRVIPPGALRAFLNEHRADVLPLVPARVTFADAAPRFGRAVTRATVVTSYGTIELEQIATPSARPQTLADARSEVALAPSPTLEGAGEPFCRLLLELVAVDRVLGGPPCDIDKAPIHAEIAYASGGGLTFDVTALHEAMIERAAVTFPPAGSTLVESTALTDSVRRLLDDDALLSLRPRGDASTLELINASMQPRVAFVDGLPAVALPPGKRAAIALRAASYLVEWRTPIGEIVEDAHPVAAPGRATASAGQFSPSSSIAPIASARSGP